MDLFLLALLFLAFAFITFYLWEQLLINLFFLFLLLDLDNSLLVSTGPTAVGMLDFYKFILFLVVCIEYIFWISKPFQVSAMFLESKSYLLHFDLIPSLPVVINQERLQYSLLELAPVFLRT